MYLSSRWSCDVDDEIKTMNAKRVVTSQHTRGSFDGQCNCVSPVRHLTGVWICSTCMAERPEWHHNHPTSSGIKMIQQRPGGNLLVSSASNSEDRANRHLLGLKSYMSLAAAERPDNAEILQRGSADGELADFGLITVST